jgi:hypothetical protein
MGKLLELLLTLKADSLLLRQNKLFCNMFRRINGILTKSNKELTDMMKELSIIGSIDDEIYGYNLESFIEFYDMLYGELEPHIYWDLLEQYYGDNATGEVYKYQPPNKQIMLN